MPIKVNIKDVRQLEATLVEKYNVGKSLPGPGNFDDFTNFGSYRINGSYTNAPNSTCGTNASLTASMIGTLNVFALGDNTAAITQQLFWLKDEVVNQYQRSYYNNGSNMTWTDWKKLIKCDDYATDTEVGGIKIGFTPGNSGVIPVLLDSNYKAYIELLAKNIRYAIANDTTINGNKYWLKNKTIIIPDGGGANIDYSEGLRIANDLGEYSVIALGTDNTSTGLNADGKQWNIVKHPTGELTISFDRGFDINNNKTGLTLYKNGDIYWKGAKLNLPRATPLVSGWLHADDYINFNRIADHAQITLASEELSFSKEQNYISGYDIFGNGNGYLDFDDSGMYNNSGSYNLVAGRRYEVIINMGMSIPAGGGLITLQLEETGGAVIKSTPMTANEGYFTMSLSCIVDGGIPILVSIQKDSGMELNLEQNQCWFAVHEIK